VRFEVLHPRPADYAGTPKPNAVSCVLRITAGQTSVLLAGDIEQAQEARLVADGRDLRATVLLVPHHGSKTSSSEALLDAVQPEIALVQAGYRNRFSHPAPPVVQRYLDRNVRVIQTSVCGAIRWSSAAPALVECERDQSMRYWQHRIRQTSSSRP
jgi:competence protein ComEC